MAVIVGVDGSAHSRHVLAWAIEEARLRGERVVAMMVYHVPPMYYPHGIPGAASPTIVERIRQGAEEELAGILADVGSLAEGAAVEAHAVEHPQPARALTRRAGEGDLIVVGSRGIGGFKGLLLGSVSQQVVQHARCPVVVLHPADGEQGGRTEATAAAEAAGHPAT